MQTFIFAYVVTTALCGQTTAEPLSDAAPAPETAPDRQRQLEKFAADAAGYEVTMLTPAPTRLELLPKPILNWHGSAFLWMRQGRPEVIGAFWTNTNPRTQRLEYGHAFHSLSDHPITAVFDSQVVWSPNKPGLQFRAVEGAEAAAPDARGRLVQLRSLAREFSAVQWKGGRSQLRLLTQPIYRYESTPSGAKDGAIFAFTNTQYGTDPDAFLILEARESGESVRWEYAFARFHYVELTGHHGDKEVWRVEDAWLERKQHVFGAGPGREDIYYSVLRP